MGKSTSDVAKIIKLLLGMDITYSTIEECVGVNRFYLWHIVNTLGYKPPTKIARKLGMWKYKDLLSMPMAELRWAIENREEI
jgi:hypothetical protein